MPSAKFLVASAASREYFTARQERNVFLVVSNVGETAAKVLIYSSAGDINEDVQPGTTRTFDAISLQLIIQPVVTSPVAEAILLQVELTITY